MSPLELSYVYQGEMGSPKVIVRSLLQFTGKRCVAPKRYVNAATLPYILWHQRISQKCRSGTDADKHDRIPLRCGALSGALSSEGGPFLRATSYSR